MDEPQPHEMRLERTLPDGAEEWFCPTCGRRFLMQWPPAYRKIILDPGDERAIHNGGRGGLRLGPLEFTESGQTAPAQESRSGAAAVADAEAALATGLQPWLNWMRAAGLCE